MGRGKHAAPTVGNLITSVLHMLHSCTVCVKSPMIPHLLQGNLIIGDALYTGAIDVLISQNPTLPHYSPYYVLGVVVHKTSFLLLQLTL